MATEARRATRWVLAFGLVAAAAAAGEAAPFKVVVHPASKGTAIRREQLAGIFLKKLTQWGDGTAVQPVDQSYQSPIRTSFSIRVLGMPISLVQAHWQRQSVSGGERPPVARGSDEEVIAFVASTPGAIGYVSADATTGDSVKVLKLID